MLRVQSPRHQSVGEQRAHQADEGSSKGEQCEPRRRIVINPASKQAYLGIIDELTKKGAQGVIAGCIEIELFIQQSDLAVPLFPTARLHAEAAVQFALDQ